MNKEKILPKLYGMMSKIRITEETIAGRYSEQEMRCPTHLSIGQEAVAAAAGLAMRKDDFAVSTHRAHAHYLGKGGNLNSMIAEIYGKESGCSKGIGGSMHLIDKSVGFMGSTAIVGGTIPVGVGLGFSAKLKKTDQLSCVFLGDGAVEEGVFYESVNFAVLKKLPVLFICENNMYSVYSPMHVRQPKGRKIHKMVQGIGMKSSHGDGNDVLEAYAKIEHAIKVIRSGEGPYFLEFDTYRWREHCGPNYDNHIGYRTEAEYEEWKKRDPLVVAVETNAEILSVAVCEQIHKASTSEVEAAFEFARHSAKPSLNDALGYLYK